MTALSTQFVIGIFASRAVLKWRSRSLAKPLQVSSRGQDVNTLCKYHCGPASIFCRGNIGTKLKNLILYILAISNKWKSHGFKRRVSYERYPKEKDRFWLSFSKNKFIGLYERLLDVTINIYLKSCAYHPETECWHSSVGIWRTQNALTIHC